MMKEPIELASSANEAVSWDDETFPAPSSPPRPYTYRSISPGRNIRLLKLFGTNNPDERLKVQLIEISLELPPEYYAISYCWGGQQPSRHVDCDGGYLMVTANCEGALHRFRRRLGEDILVWIDGICINQSPNQTQERNHQVALMGEVYRSAVQVWAWLGSSKLDHIDPRYPKVLTWLADMDKAAMHPDGTRRQDLVREVVYKVNFVDLSDIRFHMPWFQRAWVVQEVALAKSSLLFRDDNIVISSSGLCRALDILRSCTQEIGHLMSVCVEMFSLVRRFRVLDSVAGVEDCATMMWYTKYSSSSDAKDKIFASQVLLCEIGVDLPKPDYSKPTAEIYREAMAAMLRGSLNLPSNRIEGCGSVNVGSDWQTKNQKPLPRVLELLEGVHGLGRTSNLASWVPDWSSATHPLPPIWGFDEEYRASGKSQRMIGFWNDETVLHLKGVVVQSIATCTNSAIAAIEETPRTPHNHLDWPQNMQPQEQYWIGLLEQHPQDQRVFLSLWNIHVLRSWAIFALGPDFSRAKRALLTEFYSCLCSFTVDYSASEVETEADIWDKWLSVLMDPDNPLKGVTDTTSPTPLPKSGKSRFGLPGAQENLRELVEEITSVSNAQTYSSLIRTREFKICESFSRDTTHAGIWNMLQSSLHFQTMFRTQSGRLGMAPHSIREDDQISLLAGIIHPMIVRPQGEEYRLMCPAYVHGIMRGEAWDPAWDSGDGLKDFLFV